MISGLSGAALALLIGYLALFFRGSVVAAQAAGRPVWLFARAKGRDQHAAIGFRAAFALAFFGLSCCRFRGPRVKLARRGDRLP